MLLLLLTSKYTIKKTEGSNLTLYTFPKILMCDEKEYKQMLQTNPLVTIKNNVNERLNVFVGAELPTIY